MWTAFETTSSSWRSCPSRRACAWSRAAAQQQACRRPQTMARTSNPLALTDQRILDKLNEKPDLPITNARVRAAHEEVLGTTAGAGACIVRLDRAGLLRTESGELGARGKLAQARASGAPLPPREPRAARPPRERASRGPVRKAGAMAVMEEFERLQGLHPDKS